MRYDLLKHIDAPDPLACLFNQYLKGLSTLAIMAEPSYVTMAEVHALYAGTGKARDRNHLRHSARRYFELTVLRNSLHDIHAHVGKAIALLEAFFADYQGDLLRYAVENRVQSLEQYGSDQDDDWYRDNETDASEPWKVVYKDDPESLRYYTLHHELGYHFGQGDTRGEYIGTSGPEAFYPYSTMVQHQSAFSFRKMLTAFTGQDVTFTRVADDGSQQPMSLADHLEDELNEDIRSSDLVQRFDTVLAMGAALAQHYRQLPTTAGPEAYQVLLDCLRLVRDVHTENQPPF